MSEASEVKRIGASAQKNSGRGHYQKGDALYDLFTVDFKEYAKSFSLTKVVWAKVCNDAFRNGNTEPALKIILGSGNNKTRLWVVAEHIIEDYVRLLEKERNE